MVPVGLLLVGPGKADTKQALDCGCGIGRVSKGVLFPVFETIELLDMMEDFILHAHECYLGDYADCVETYFLDSLQDFKPPLDRYDVIWMQWVAGCHLQKKVSVEPLSQRTKSLRPKGVIMAQHGTAPLDNMARQGCRLDPVDSSLIRHLDIMKSIILKPGLTILDIQKQEFFPDIIVPVRLIAMQ
ncbi:N-terminal Xaa-Pro-Lys N-methyltransferase 2 [Tachysurus vachellii]|uniref:N-terminal Xaa-Pro-Lys N-methyltransferase 2 n=1 Tax=Tachysurus vachellii TaxID=175792 RepID=UPI00296AB925|nr:N-terminal Xaa-Pro-Lys N-methyltransferase 2 [Tachysurus vachellii]